MPAIFWFRRDLRLQDHPALNAAAEVDGTVFAIASPVDYQDAATLAPVRQESLWASWRSLNSSINDGLTIVAEPVEAITQIAEKHNIRQVFVSAAYDPKSIAYMKQARQSLAKAGLELVVGPGNYAVSPGKVRKPDGSPYRVYTHFFKAWSQLAWNEPVVTPVMVKFQRDTEMHIGLDSPHTSVVPGKIRAGEDYATRTFDRFVARGALANYNEQRNRADLSGTSHLSHALSHGEIHPRTLLSQLGDSEGEVTFAKELAWREFYADVLWHNPESLTEYLEPRFASMRYDDGTDIGESRFEAWKQGRTGFPMVDAGMRQLLAMGWMHNRVRMIVASFLVKDLHLEWQRGAEWFEQHLTDFDPASNSHGWQWTAGCGTDASPYYRVFNPILQGLKFDPNGDYVRKYIPELAHIDGAAVHEPWLLIDGMVNGYVPPIVDHAVERDESLARLAEIKKS